MSQVKKAIEKGNIDGAKIYAQNAIRKKTEALNYLRLASRLDAVVSRLDTQAKMNMINSSMSQIVRALDRVRGLPFQLHAASGALIKHAAAVHRGTVHAAFVESSTCALVIMLPSSYLGSLLAKYCSGALVRPEL